MYVPRVSFAVRAVGLLCWATSLTGCSANLPTARDFVLVESGRSVCTVIATGDKTVDADIAFFTNSVARMSGAELVVVGSGSCRKDVADSALPLQLDTTTNRIVFEIREADLFHEDDYEITFPDAKTMRIVGTDQSCRWALNRLLEEKGVVFCSAGPHGTHWPQAKDLSFSFERRVSPDVTIRLERDLYVEDPAWQRSMGGKKQKGRFFWHNMCDMFPLSKYGREPWLSKLMPEKNGKRTCPKEQEVGWQPCYASEEGIAETVRIICDHLDRHPEEKVYSLAVNDHEGYCECAACKKLNGGTFETKSAYMVRYRNFSPAYYSWVNKVAKGVAKRHPHVVLGLLAYCGVIDPPPFKLEPNVVPYFCYDIQQLSDEKTRTNRLKLMGEWSKVAKSIGIWDYSFGCPGYACFREYPDEQALFFGLKKTVCPALDGFFTEGQGTYFSSEWRRRYLYLRLAFDASRDPAAELDRWYRACVGEAAAADLKAYYGVWDGFWRSPALKATNWYKHGVMGPYFAYEDKQPLFALDAATRQKADALMTSLLAKAEASGTDDQRIRARKLKHMHDYYAMKQVECLYGLTGAGEKVTKEIAEEYLRRIPEAETARQQLPALLEKVCADALDGTNIYVKGRVAQVRRLSANNSNKTLLMNGALQQVGAKRLAEAMGYRLGDVNVAHIDGVPAWTLCKRGLEVAEAESVNGTPRWKLTANDFWWKAGYACVTGLVPRCSYAVSARVTNPLSRPVNVTVGLNSSMPPHWRPSDLGTFASTTLKAGETKTVTALHTLHPKTSAGKILISIGGLKPGEHVFADSISLKTFGPAEGTTPLNQ